MNQAIDERAPIEHRANTRQACSTASAPRRGGRWLLALLGPWLMAEATQALPLPTGDLERSCWAQHTRARTRPSKDPTTVDFSNLRDGEAVTSPLSLHFGVAGYGVSAAGPALDRTGHLTLQVLQNGKPLQTQDLANGATQSTLSLPNGRYQRRQRFVDGANRRDPMPPCEHELPVTGQERM